MKLEQDKLHSHYYIVKETANKLVEVQHSIV